MGQRWRTRIWQKGGIILNKGKLISKPPQRCGSNLPSDTTTWKLSTANHKAPHWIHPESFSPPTAFVWDQAHSYPTVYSGFQVGNFQRFPNEKSVFICCIPYHSYKIISSLSCPPKIPMLTLLSDSANKKFGIYILSKTAHSIHSSYVQIFSWKFSFQTP
jgi:hypothetical protein